MNEMLRKTREWLNCSTRRSFSAVLHEAKITPRQMQICELKFVKGLTNYQIAAELNVSDQPPCFGAAFYLPKIGKA